MASSEGPANIGVADLLRYHFPVPAIVSILHRISGVLLFIAIPFLLWALDFSLKSPAHFQALLSCLSSSWGHLILWGFLAALFFHVIAGVKHLIMDLGIGESLQVARRSAWLIVILQLVMMIVMGVWLWPW